jgi:ribonuclease HI
VVADSSYVIDALTKWRHGWKRRGWRTASGEPVKNRDLMERLDELMAAHAPTFEWVRGHDGHPANEAADVRARAAATAIAGGDDVDTGPGLRS